MSTERVTVARATVAEQIERDAAPTVDDWDDYRGAATFTRLGNDETTGAPVSWATTAPDPRARPDVNARITRSRKRGGSFRVDRGAAWLRTAGDDRDVIAGPTIDGAPLTVPAVDRTERDAAYGVTRERDLVARADAILAASADRDVTSPRGNVTRWDDTAGRTARLGGFGLTDRPASPSAQARAMRPQVVGSRGERGLADDAATDPGDYCATHRGAVGDCGCVIPRRVTVGACAVNRYDWEQSTIGAVAAGDAWHGFTGETTMRGSWRERQSVGAPSRSAVYDALDVLHETTNDAGDVVRRVRGFRDASAPVVIYDRRDMTATVHDDGAVLSLLGWVESVAVTVDDDGAERRDVSRVAMVGHDRFTIDRREPTTRAGRAASRAAGRSLIDRRAALARSLVDAFGRLAVGESATVDADGAPVTVTRPTVDRYDATRGADDPRRWGRTVAAVAHRVARDVIDR